MAHSLPHNLKNLCHSQITTAHRHLSTYVHTMKFLCGLQRFVPFFIYLKPDTKRCKPHGTPSTWPWKTRSSTCHSHWRTLIPTLGKIYSQNAFPIGTPGTFQHWTTQHNGTEIFKVLLDSVIFTRSLRGLYEIGILQGKAAGQGGRDPFYSSLRFSSLLFCI